MPRHERTRATSSPSAWYFFSIGLWLLAAITPDWGFADLFLPQAIRGFAVLLCIVPTVNLALRGLAGPDLRYGSGLFNLIAQSRRRHRHRRGGHLATRRHDLARGATGRGAGRTSPGTHRLCSAHSPAAWAAIRNTPCRWRAARSARVVARQATAKSFDDVFSLMAVLFLGALILGAVLQAGAAGAGRRRWRTEERVGGNGAIPPRPPVFIW